MKHIPMPEFLNRRDIPNGLWTVEELRSSNGVGAATDIQARHMVVPVGTSDMARTVRAHEMMHARISPPDKNTLFGASEKWGIDPKTIEVAEEYRVNCLVHAAGFDVDALADGSHSHLGKVWGSDSNWNSIVLTAALFAGFKPSADLLRGVKQSNPTYHAKVLELIKELKKYVGFTKLRKTTRLTSLGSTAPIETTFGTIPSGFIQTKHIAKIIHRYLENDPEEATSDNSTDDGTGSTEHQPETAPGEFAHLLWDKSIELKPYLKGNLLKKRVASDIGRNPRRITRALTDGKIFDRVTRSNGGIIVIDQSGSMAIPESAVREMVQAAPGCTVVGYSHAAGSTNTPNVWVLAEGGKISPTIPPGNSGNGVDGPVLEWAIKQRRKGEPLIWVCDGVVTDGADDYVHTHLTSHCADLVKKHKIHMVETTEEAVEAIRAAAKGKPVPMHAVGLIYDSLKERTPSS
jgi:hypothetical protein